MKRVVIVLFCVVVALVSMVWLVLAALVNHERHLKIALGYDNTGNATLGGDEDETLCSRAWRRHQHSRVWAFWRVVFDWIFSGIEDNHCRNAYLREVAAKRAWLDKHAKGHQVMEG